jgi:3-hydroxybutyryl-CoA dehydrogenase
MSRKAPIAIVGGGLMGHGIAQVFACAGHPVRVQDPSAEVLATLDARIRRNLRELGLDETAAARVSGHPTLAAAVADAEFIFEAGPENLILKQELFAAIEAAAPAESLLASNTSVIPITQIMARLKHPARALGTHWWNPPYLVPLVEVIRTPTTAAAALASMMALLRAAGKTPVSVRKDVPGFIGNRLQHALWREAMALVEQGICDAETVDTVVKASFGRRLAVLGPLENADLVGTDLTLAIHETVLPDLDRTPGPLTVLKQLVAQGKLGMKSGEGFRHWTPEQQVELRNRVLAHLKTFEGPVVQRNGTPTVPAALATRHPPPMSPEK